MREHLHAFLLRLKALFHKSRLDRDMADELAFHQAMMHEKLAREGVPSANLESTTRRKFGNPSRWHERLRELWQFRTLANLGRDIAFSFRVLRKSPGFTAVALLTLALGVGANTTIFCVIDGLLLRPLDVPTSDRLAVLGMDMGEARIWHSFSGPLFRGLEHRHASFDAVFAFAHSTFQVRRGSGVERVDGQMVSGDFFSALQTPPLLGRTLTPSDDQKGGDPAGFGVVISELFWQSWFNRDPNVIGQKLVIDNAAFTVVGVMPKRFIGADPLDRPSIFAPLSVEPVFHGDRSMIDNSHAWWIEVMGRLRPSVSLQQADAEVAASTASVIRSLPLNADDLQSLEKRHIRMLVESGSTGLTETRLEFRKPLVAVFAMCCGILILACLNLASLLMARGAARQPELATRLALGATRRRLIQQLMVESLLIALMGATAGLAVAPLVSKSLTVLLLGSLSEQHIDTSLDLRVFTFAALASIGAALLVGLIPALQATSKELNEQIKSGQHTTRAQEHRRILPKLMMAGEVALALLLVVGAGLLASSLVRLYRVGPGFDPKGLDNISLSLDQQHLKGSALLDFYQRIEDGLSRQPGVSSVTIARIIPFSHYTWDEDLTALTDKPLDTYFNQIGPNYFQTMRIPLIAGRDFNSSDTLTSGPKMVLNQAAAKALFPNRNPLGQTVTKKEGKGTVQYEVVGVVGDAKYENLRDPAPPSAYLPITQDDFHLGPSYDAVVRTQGAPGPLADTARSLAQSLAPTLPAPRLTPMKLTIDDSLSSLRTMALLAVFFAGCALIVTAIGLYGTLAYAAAQRTNEIGIRMALGARRSQVVGMVFRQNAIVALSGTALGLIVALLASRALASFLYGISARDPWVFAGAILALALIASAASLLPALRSARINPLKAIRCD